MGAICAIIPNLCRGSRGIVTILIRIVGTNPLPYVYAIFLTSQLILSHINFFSSYVWGTKNKNKRKRTKEKIVATTRYFFVCFFVLIYFIPLPLVDKLTFDGLYKSLEISSLFDIDLLYNVAYKSDGLGPKGMFTRGISSRDMFVPVPRSQISYVVYILGWNLIPRQSWGKNTYS